MIKVDPWNTNSACWHRRQDLCIGYRARCNDIGLMAVTIFAVQNNRTPAFLGIIKLARDEWKVFHTLIFRKWEDLDYPMPNDLIKEMDEP